MDGAKEQGCFAVKLVRDRKIGVRAQLTGQHWKGNDLAIAKAIVFEESKRSMMNHDSPIYLIPEHVVKCAMKHKDDPETATQMMMYAVGFNPGAKPIDEITGRIVAGVHKTLGGTVIDVPWGEALSEEEVDEIFSAFGVERKKQ